MIIINVCGAPRVLRPQGSNSNATFGLASKVLYLKARPATTDDCGAYRTMERSKRLPYLKAAHHDF